MRVLFFSMGGMFAHAPLRALLGAGHEVCAVVVPAQRGAPFAIWRVPPLAPAGPIPLLQVAEQQGVLEQAIARGVPLFELARAAHADSLAVLAEFAADVACVACWPRRIPPALLALPRYGFLNLHPSLLPLYRGPEPLFWTLRDGAPVGVTVHQMDAGLDSGPIAAQAPVALPDAVTAAEAEQRCAEVGAQLLTGVLAQLDAGTHVLRAQPDGVPSYPAPTPADFALDVAWPARRAFNFVRGVAEWGEPFPMLAGGARLRVLDALSYDSEAALDAPFEHSGDVVRIQFSPGVLVCIADVLRA